jgi:hypothetical protein
MAERKGSANTSQRNNSLTDKSDSFEQVLSPGLRSVHHPAAEATQELTAGRPSYGTVFHVREPAVRLFSND